LIDQTLNVALTWSFFQSFVVLLKFAKRRLDNVGVVEFQFEYSL